VTGIPATYFAHLAASQARDARCRRPTAQASNRSMGHRTSPL